MPQTATFRKPHRSASSAFKAEIETVEQALQAIPSLRAELARSVGQQAAENFVQRAIIKANFISLVGAFQSAAEVRFFALPTPLRLVARKNLFQNFKESGELWRGATGRGLDRML